MTLEGALNYWLTTVTGLDAYWLERPASAVNAVVYRCITPGVIEGNLRGTGLWDDRYSISLYHNDPDVGKALADAVRKQLHHFSGDLAGYPIQFAEFTSGLDQALPGDTGTSSYQFNRDFTITHTGA